MKTLNVLIIKKSKLFKIVSANMFCIFSFVFLAASAALSAPVTTTFQAKILKPDNTPLESGSVNFQFSTLSPTGSCVLYVEQFNSISMVGSSGVIVLNLGSAATPVYRPPGKTLYADIFDNSSSMNCQSSGSYIPSANDRRRLFVQFDDGSGAGWQSLPAMDINSVPYAFFSSNTEKISGKTVSDFVLNSILPGSACSGSQVLTYSGGVFSCVASGTGSVTNVTSANSYLSILNNSTTPALTVNVGTAANTLAAGDDSRILGAAQKANNLSDLASATTARTNLGLGTAAVLNAGTSANNLVQLDGTAKIPASLLPAGSGTVTSVTGTAPVAVATGTSTPVISMAAATASVDGYLKATDFTIFNNKLSASISGPSLAQVIRYNGSSWVNASLSSADLSNDSNLLKASNMPANCSASQALTFSSPTGTWVCSNISSLDGSVLTTGTVATARLGSGTASSSTYLRGDNSWSSFATDALAVALTGLSTATSTAITASDTLLSSIGKLQAQVTTLSSLAPSSWSAQSSDFTAVAGGRYLVDTSSGAITLTLPASPSFGTTIQIVDAAGTFNTNNLIVGRNSLKIMGLAEDMTVSTQNISFELVYYNAANGWRIK